MPRGIVDTTMLDLPGNIDRQELLRYRTASGTRFDALARQLDARCNRFNGTLDPFVAQFIAPPTTNESTESQIPTAFEVRESAETDVPRPNYTEAAGLMIPLRVYDVSPGQWTDRSLPRQSTASLMGHMDAAFLGFRNLHRREVLKRFFSIDEVRISKSSTATSPGFAGSGTGGNVFPLQMYPDGTPVGANYTHYHYSTDAGFLTMVKTMRDKLKKWFPTRTRFELLGSKNIVDRFSALTPEQGYVRTGSVLIRPALGTAEALVDSSQYEGVYDGDIVVAKPLVDFNTPHFSIYVNFGSLSPQNPLIWRYDEIDGRGVYLKSRSLYPFAQAILLQSLGIGVNNRLAATFGYADDDATAYTNPL